MGVWGLYSHLCARYEAQRNVRGQSAMRRVVVTGLGLVTPLADGIEASWSRLLDGQSGAGPITGFDPTGLATTYACEVPLGVLLKLNGWGIYYHVMD